MDRPAIQYVLEEAARSGIEEAFVVVSPAKRVMRQHFAPVRRAEFGTRVPETMRSTVDLLDKLRIRFLVQRQARGLGHAVYQARRVLGREPFAVLLGDDILLGGPPCTRQLLQARQRVGGSIVAVEKKPLLELKRYGVADISHRRGRIWPVRGFVEKPAPRNAPSRFAILGRYVLEPEIFPILRSTPPGYNGEIQLTDALTTLARRRRVSAFSYKGRRIDVGNTVDWILANVEIGLRHPRYRLALNRRLASLKR